jgi:hypothetical protein
MKLKLIAAVVGLTLSAASQATIVPTTTVGGSDLLLDVWEQSAPGGQKDQSFTLDLGMTFTQFVANAGTSATLATLLSTDSTWNSFLSSSDTTDAGALQWSVIASGSKVPTTRPAIFGTATVGSDPTTQGAAGFLTNNDINVANTQVATTISNLNTVANPNESVNLSGSGSYYQDDSLANFNQHGIANGNSIGALNVAQVWTASNTGAGTAAATMTQLAGTMTFSQVGGNYLLVYAVPEAPGFGMALAGLAALGFLAIRRRNA